MRNGGKSYTRMLFWLLLAAQFILSLIILVPIFYESTKEFTASLTLTTEQKQISKYGHFYRSMKDYIRQIPAEDNAVIFEPPGERAAFFWILNYFFLPRKIYTFPEYFMLDNDFTAKRGIKFVLIPQEKRFYFKRHVPRMPDIMTKSPVNFDTLAYPPLFSWVAPDTGPYSLSLCSEYAEVLNTYRDLEILLTDRWTMPQGYWSSIPRGQKVYWFVRSVDQDMTSGLMVFYKK